MKSRHRWPVWFHRIRDLLHFTNYTYKATKANELQDERKEEEEMGVGMKRGSALTLFVVMMLLHTKTCRAATSPLRKSNTTTIINGCSGNLQKCLIGDVDSELLLDLETSSSLVLLNVGKFLALNTNEPKKPAVPCGNGRQYRTCFTQKNKVRKQQHCGIYTRRCWCRCWCWAPMLCPSLSLCF